VSSFIFPLSRRDQQVRRCRRKGGFRGCYCCTHRRCYCCSGAGALPSHLVKGIKQSIHRFAQRLFMAPIVFGPRTFEAWGLAQLCRHHHIGGCPSFAAFAKLGTTDLTHVHSSHTNCKAPYYTSLVPNQLRRYYGAGHLHFITTSCFRRMPLLARPQCRDLFLEVLERVRRRIAIR
jgi:hypothetical protein